MDLNEYLDSVEPVENWTPEAAQMLVAVLPNSGVRHMLGLTKAAINGKMVEMTQVEITADGMTRMAKLQGEISGMRMLFQILDEAFTETQKAETP